MKRLAVRLVVAAAAGLGAYAAAVLLLFTLLLNGLMPYGSPALEWGSTLFAWGIGLAAAWAAFMRQWRAPLLLAALAVLVFIGGHLVAVQEENARERAWAESTGPGRRAAVNAFGPGAGKVTGDFLQCQDFSMVRVEGEPEGRIFWYDRRAGQILDSVTDSALRQTLAAALGPDLRLTGATIREPGSFTFAYETGGRVHQGLARLGDDCAFALSRIDRDGRGTAGEVRIPLTPRAAEVLKGQEAATEQARQAARSLVGGTAEITLDSAWYRFSERGLWLLVTRETGRDWLWYDLAARAITNWLTEDELTGGIGPALRRGWRLDGLTAVPGSPQVIRVVARKGEERATPAPEVRLSPEGLPEGSLRWSGPVRPDTQRERPVAIQFPQ